MCNTRSTVEISRRQAKHLKHASETLARIYEKHLRTIANIFNI
jgi:hypothetical protein